MVAVRDKNILIMFDNKLDTYDIYIAMISEDKGK